MVKAVVIARAGWSVAPATKRIDLLSPLDQRTARSNDIELGHVTLDNKLSPFGEFLVGSLPSALGHTSLAHSPSAFSGDAISSTEV